MNCLYPLSLYWQIVYIGKWYFRRGKQRNVQPPLVEAK